MKRRALNVMSALLGAACAFTLGAGLSYARYKQPVSNNKVYRAGVIKDHTQQLGRIGTLVIGDSLIERQVLGEICGLAVNAGVGSATSADLVVLSQSLADTTPDRLVIVAGANDVIQNRPPQELQDNVEHILKNLHAAQALIFGVPGRGPADDALRRAAEGHAAIFVPWPITDVSDTHDGLHLNASGAAKWQAVAKAMLGCD